MFKKLSYLAILIVFVNIPKKCASRLKEASEKKLSTRHKCSVEELAKYEDLCYLLDRAATKPDTFANELMEWSDERGIVVKLPNPLSSKVHGYQTRLVGFSSQPRSLIDKSPDTNNPTILKSTENNITLPVVLAHGMGDSCFNYGMMNTTEFISSTLNGTYATCVPTGEDRTSDTLNGFVLNMDANVDVFAEKIQNDPALRNGFNAVGFSQGSNVIRGYIARYNNPPVDAFLSIDGVNAGTAGLPDCAPSKNNIMGRICKSLMRTLSTVAYRRFVQKHLFQANYWRDPTKINSRDYQKNSQLARWGNEGDHVDSSLNENFSKTNKFVWILAEEDSMVWPREGAQWGEPNPANPFDSVIAMNETRWYVDDLFGLRKADESGKLFFESRPGDHLQYSREELENWIIKYLL